MKPATAQVLEELRANPAGITALEALDAGCGDSLAQRVHELRQAGYAIADGYETTPNGARVKRYRLAPEPRMVHAGHPVGRVRTCPSCHGQHAVGTTCAWRATA